MIDIAATHPLKQWLINKIRAVEDSEEHTPATRGTLYAARDLLSYIETYEKAYQGQTDAEPLAIIVHAHSYAGLVGPVLANSFSEKEAHDACLATVTAFSSYLDHLAAANQWQLW